MGSQKKNTKTKGLFYFNKNQFLKKITLLYPMSCKECMKRTFIHSITTPPRFMECQNRFFLIYLSFQFYLSVLLFTIKIHLIQKKKKKKKKKVLCFDPTP